MNNDKTIKVAIQGIPGSNHDIAARAFYQNTEVELIACMSFQEVFQAVNASPEAMGMIAIENTLVGGLLSNYTLLKEYGFKIIGEYKLRIKHQLMALPGQRIEDISEVHSHPMALAQCKAYFEEYPYIELIESEDTAFSAKWIEENDKKGVAAIAPALASELYNLNIIGKDIETNKHNYTRFLAIGKEGQGVSNSVDALKANKASLALTLPHEEGSLSKILSILAAHNINLTRIQSLPIVGKEWEYLFYIDVVFETRMQYKQSLDAIYPFCSSLTELGIYASADLLYAAKEE